MRAIATCAVAVVLLGCGGASASEATVRSTVDAYFAALRHGQATAACRMLTEPSRERLAEFGADVLKTGHASCAATYKALFASIAGPRLRHLAAPRITRVTRTGDRARARVDGIGTPITLVRGKEGWRIDSSPAVEPDKQG